MSRANPDATEKNAVARLDNYFDNNGIIREISVGDRTRLIDGFLIIDNTKYDIQVKGTTKLFKDHSILKKYFKYALSNFLVYIVVDNLVDGLFSNNSKAYYTVIDFNDANLGLKNSQQMTVNKFDFFELNSYKKFIKYVEKKFDKYIEFRHNGIDLMSASEYGNKFTMVGNIDDDLNFTGIKIKNVFIEDVPIKINMSEGTEVEIGIVKNENIVMHGSGIKLQERKNLLVNKRLLIYEKMKITIFTDKDKFNISIKEENLSPFRAEIYENYIKILEKDFNYNFSVEESEENFVFCNLKKMIKLRNYLVEHEIYLEKFDEPDIIAYLLNVSENGLNYEEGKSIVIFYETSKGYIARSNYKDIENQIIKDLMLFKIYSNEDKEIEYIGYSLMFSMKTEAFIRKCINFDYVEMLKRDKEQFEKNFPDELILMIVFNYLLIYWEFNKSKKMLGILKSLIKKMISKTKNIPLFINYLQIKKILGEEFTIAELKRLIILANGSKTIPEEYDKTIVKLICLVLLERKSEASKLYEKLSEEQCKVFNEWPIKYLYKEMW